MAFCKNCGTEIIDGAKFCHNCGCVVSNTSSYAGEQRQQEYSGKLYKCPGCGEVLKSFMTNCPACGLELRGAKASNAVREFALKLEAIETKRENKSGGLLSKIGLSRNKSKTIDQKISLIQGFPIPNTKEDILEFMILATANIDMAAFGSFDDNKDDIALSNAWLSKVKQAHSKARKVYGSDEDILQIEKLYEECVKDIRRQKRKRILMYFFVIGCIPILTVILLIIDIPVTKNRNQNEEVRLNNVVQQIQTALEDGEYKIALMHAESIEYKGSDREQKRQWPINREYWIEKVIEEAAAHGIHLERTPDDAEPEGQDSSSNGVIQNYLGIA